MQIRHISKQELANYYEGENLLNPQENQFFIMDTQKLRYKSGEFKNVSVKKIKGETAELKHRNEEQEMAIDLLLDDEIKLVVLTGKAGCGKTYLATQVGLHKVFDKKAYNRLFFVRNNIEITKSIGALPGEKFDKIKPYLSSIVDQLGGWEAVFYLMEANNKIEAEALGYMQGRSLKDTYIIVDEAQNLTVSQVKMLVTRVAEGSKIILTGDLEQTANCSFDRDSGIKEAIDRFSGYSLFGYLELQKTERSELAELAALLL